jgi:hypothetical protein
VPESRWLVTGTNFNNYPSLTTVPVAADTLLVLDTTDDSASGAGTVKQVTLSLAGLVAAQVIQRMTAN